LDPSLQKSWTRLWIECRQSIFGYEITRQAFAILGSTKPTVGNRWRIGLEQLITLFAPLLAGFLSKTHSCICIKYACKLHASIYYVTVTMATEL
jgi:hypothetical protein